MINLFIEYYKSPETERQKELDYCIKNNLENSNIDRVILFYTQETCSIQNDKITRARIDGRLRYADFFLHVRNGIFSDDDVFILANSDIYFDESLSLLKRSDLKNNSICLSRYEGKILHRSPRQSQDAWIIGKREIPVKLIMQSDFYLGLPGCDNRIAYVLHENGFNPYNPCKYIKCYHKHSSNIRTYNRAEKVPGPYMMLEQLPLR